MKKNTFEQMNTRWAPTTRNGVTLINSHNTGVKTSRSGAITLLRTARGPP